MLRDGLAGRTVKLVLTEAKEEEPAFGVIGLTMSGWKRCMGKDPTILKNLWKPYSISNLSKCLTDVTAPSIPTALNKGH
jgi:hypothetical protein